MPNMFSVATAITRLTGGKYNLLLNLSAGQSLQRINEILEKFYDRGSWRGLHDTISLTSIAGIISLPAAYQRLDGLGQPSLNWNIPIKPMQWAFANAGPRVQDWTLYGNLIAIDKGETAGVRKYQLSGAAVDNDLRTLSGLARKRFVWITNTADIVAPDCFTALELAVRAMNAADEQANELSKDLWEQAFSELNTNLEEYGPQERQVKIVRNFGGPVHSLM